MRQLCALHLQDGRGVAAADGVVSETVALPIRPRVDSEHVPSVRPDPQGAACAVEAQDLRGHAVDVVHVFAHIAREKDPGAAVDRQLRGQQLLHGLEDALLVVVRAGVDVRRQRGLRPAARRPCKLPPQQLQRGLVGRGGPKLAKELLVLRVLAAEHVMQLHAIAQRVPEPGLPRPLLAHARHLPAVAQEDQRGDAVRLHPLPQDPLEVGLLQLRQLVHNDQRVEAEDARAVLLRRLVEAEGRVASVDVHAVPEALAHATGQLCRRKREEHAAAALERPLDGSEDRRGLAGPGRAKGDRRLPLAGLRQQDVRLGFSGGSPQRQRPVHVAEEASADANTTQHHATRATKQSKPRRAVARG